MSSKLKLFVIWLAVFLVSLFVSFLLINNAIELPFHDKARDIVGFNSSGHAIDSQGNIIDDWQSNNYLDDVIKAAVVLLALFAYWKLASIYISKLWIKVILGISGIAAIVVGGYILSFILYGIF